MFFSMSWTLSVCEPWQVPGLGWVSFDVWDSCCDFGGQFLFGFVGHVTTTWHTGVTTAAMPREINVNISLPMYEYQIYMYKYVYTCKILHNFIVFVHYFFDVQISGATNCIEVLLATAQMRWGPPAHGAPQLQPSGWMRQVLGALLVSSGACVLMHFFAQPLLSVIFIFLLAFGVWSHFAKGKMFFLTFFPPCKYNLLLL